MALMLASTATPTSGATPAQVNAAIEKSIAYLYSMQKPSGRWETADQRAGTSHDVIGMQGDTFGGYTALATYALLAAGENPQDPRLQRAISFLADGDIMGIYSIGVRANIWPLLPASDKRYKALSEHDAFLLVNGMQTGHERAETRGFWEYGNGRGPGLRGSTRFDHSVSQYGVLGLWACAENGVEINRSVWESIDAGWRSQQYADGGWTYSTAPPEKTEKETASMTAAGVATLFITDDILYPDRGLDCRGNVANENIERGLAWMAAHFNDVTTPYAFYGVERIGAASGRKYFGPIDWYANGTDRLIKMQQANGAWKGDYPAADLSNTAFSLLFLVRGREPVMMQKLQYAVSLTSQHVLTEGNWNQRSRDVANLARWVGRHIEHDLNWAITTLDAPADDLHEAPVLYISGDQSLDFTSAEQAKLRDFIQTGGMILANADCGLTRSDFSRSFEAMGKQLFPQYAFRDLPADHPIFTHQQYPAINWKNPAKVRALSNGVRELMVLIPDADPARAWQLRSDKSSEAAFQLGADIFLYAVDRKNLSNRGESYTAHPDPNIISDHSAKIGRLVIGDNWDPEPGGWQRLGALIHNQYQLDIDVRPVRPATQNLAGYKILHLTGTNAFSLSPAIRTKLVDYVQHGGTLVIDAAGGNASFAAAATLELKACFGAAAVDQALENPLDLSAPLFNLPGATIKTIGYRDIYRRQAVGNLKGPRLDAIEQGGRPAIFFSREDLTAGLVGEPVDGIAGYSPQSATEIMRNIVLSSAFGKRPGK